MRKTSTHHEHWLPVTRYEDYYQVSDQGQVRSLDRIVFCWDGKRHRVIGRVLKPGVDKHGKRFVGLWRDDEVEHVRIAPLVLRTFVGPCPDGMECCHGNGCSIDDRLVNLRWDTHFNNVLDSVRHGTQRSTRKSVCPLEHALVMPNLRQDALRLNQRACLACARGRNTVRYALTKGIVVDLRVAAGEHYRKIMGGVA